MSKMRKLSGLLLAMIMVFAMAITASAAETTIKAPNNDRVYMVYQIMTGDFSVNEQGKETLSNAKWGKNAKDKSGAVSKDDMNAIAAISGTDAEKAAALSAYVNLNSEAVGSVTKGSSISVPTGYYLIKDMGEVKDGETYSLYIVQVAGNVTIKPKDGTTSSDKKVQDANDTDGTTTDWQDSADYDIGDDVPFKLSATVASDYDNYSATKGYKLTFHDNESAGLTFKPETVVVKVDGNEITDGYELVTDTDHCTFEVKFANLKNIAAVEAGSVITVEYKSRLNENAKLGSEGNANTSHVTYSNNPNNDQEGKTPDDTVIVFTYKVVANKYADEVKTGNELEGAAFELFKKVNGEYVSLGELGRNKKIKTFEWKGIDDGDYKIVETVTPVGYNTIDPIEFTVTADHDIVSPNPALNDLDGDVFTGNVETGAVTGDIVNKSGAVLPSTGGMGTTLFYLIGGICVIGAGILLISKKRTEK